MELIKDNYLRGLGTGKTWHVEIDPPKRKVKSYFEESLLTAEYMYANKDDKLFLMLSGGLDSEYVFKIFHRLKFDFTPVIIRLKGKHYETDYNLHDTKHAFSLCDKFNVTPTVIDFNFDRFVESGELFELMHRFRAGGFGQTTIMKAVTMVDGFTVHGNDPPYLGFDTDNKVWLLDEDEQRHSILRFYEGLNLKGCPFLLSYTPEMMLSFLLDPRIADLANGKFPGKTGTNSSKSYVYNNGSGFNMDHYDYELAQKISEFSVFKDNINFPRVKVHGFEMIMRLPWWNSFDEVKKNFNIENEPLYSGCYKENYHDVVKRLSVNQ